MLRGLPQRSSGQPQWILFTALPHGVGVEQIFRVQLSGKGLEQLTKGRYPSEAPAFSPDGKRVAFAQLGAGVFSMNLDGTGLRRLTDNGRDTFPSWSPNGKQIVFLRPSASGWGSMSCRRPGRGSVGLAKRLPPAGRPGQLTGS